VGLAGALTAGVVAFGLQLFVDFHFKIPALGMAFAIVTALLVQRGWPVADRAPASRPRNFAGAIAVLIVVFVWAVPFYRADALRYGARQAINRMATEEPGKEEQRRVLTQARLDLARAVAIWPTHAQAWADVAYATALWSHVEPADSIRLGKESEQASARALELSKIVPEFWLRQGVALDLQGRWSDAGGAFGEAVKRAPANSTVWFYRAYHLALNPIASDLAEAAAGFCLRLDPANKQEQELRQRLANRSKR
jgi:hypothetical protein